MRSLILAYLALLTVSCHSDQDSKNPVDLNRPINYQNQELNLSNAAPGSLVSTEFLFTFNQETINAKLGQVLPEKAQFPVDAYRMFFTTKDLLGNGRVASSVVFLPRNGQATLPLVALQHGTLTANREAPSSNPREGLFEAASGFAVLVPDYLGFGASKDALHPYLIAEAYVQNGVDSLRAFRSFASRESLKVPGFFLKGYSEGGYAVVAMQKAIESREELQNEFLLGDDFKLLASAPGAGPYLLAATAKTLLSRDSINAAYITQVVAAYKTWYPESKILYEDIFLDSGFPGKGDADLGSYIEGDLLGGSKSVTDIIASLTEVRAELMQESIIETFENLELTATQAYANEEIDTTGFAALLEANDLVQDWAPKVPTKLYHCAGDELIPAAITVGTQQIIKAQQPDAPLDIVVVPDTETAKYSHSACPAYYLPVAWFGELLSQAQ
ncbi:alpha/beta hydrolase family protein [Pseudobacteriovorax antillogorgiicola]|uniref:Secretory lipase n=1 Tax=Pseudobacteriovorax antillogorgiicola TaxID=1513793 RepID=A0A1Y6CBR7_9BACT|nr:hypothetical protein [Pseudobacteriovorax antillogorgiicola]TCS49885.1 hypothetical protein EDD56_114130 [Pseudobacteriovorax antillogorgiicola]SMF44565.1 hypothetical protein SAMN06296036_113135 [Pseudobacteriovorax antillogorgiicola]